MKTIVGMKGVNGVGEKKDTVGVSDNEQCERCGEGIIYAHVQGDLYEINGHIFSAECYVCRNCAVVARVLGRAVEVIC